jgi:ArsR family transcriptional regulator, cadmium/lead-responsive transcriptional repressor
MQTSDGPLQRVGQALADPTRQAMLVALLDGPLFSSELADRVGGSRPNVSNHLACLRGCGLVVREEVGRRVRYSLVSNSLAHALRDLLTLESDVVCAQMEPAGIQTTGTRIRTTKSTSKQPASRRPPAKKRTSNKSVAAS